MRSSPILLGLGLLLACSCSEPRSFERPAADAAIGTIDAGGKSPAKIKSSHWRSRYYDGYLAETLRGDLTTARAAYEEIVAEAGESDALFAARAALRLANLEVLAGNRREAIELVARAAVLGRDDANIVDRADQMQTHLASLRSRGSEVRGPPAGTVLESVPPEVAEAFAKAETLLEDYYEFRLRPRLEGLRAGVRAKEYAMELAVRAYRQAVSEEAVEATVAAEFRVGSLYHDLALSLMFDLPPELEAREAAKLRRSLRAQALGYLGKARVAYRRSIDVADAVADQEMAQNRWRIAAGHGLRAVVDLLGGRD